MLKANRSRRKPGRPRANSAIAHKQILDAVCDLVQKKSVRDITIEEIAERAGVSKPTLYRWWPSKAAVVMNMWEERIMMQLPLIDGLSAEQTFRALVPQIIRLFNGVFGKVAAEIIAEGQSEPDVLREFRERYVLKRRAVCAALIEHAITTGEFKRKIDPELMLDMIFGPIYYRLMVRHQKLDQRFGDDLLNHILTHVLQR